MKAPPSYEAYCPSCRVSHPPGTRQCVHCGGPVMRERPLDTAQVRAQTMQEATTVSPTPDEFEPGDFEEAGGEATRKPPGATRIILSLMWIAVAVAISVYRGCQGGG